MKKEIIKGYKGFDKNLKCRGVQFEVGKIHEQKGELKICSNGFHFCREFKNVNDFYSFIDENNVFAEIEALGNVVDDENGKKSATNKIKIVRIISKEEMLKTLNFGDDNTGFFNTGDRNTGDSNTGNSNTGYRNTGYSNTGDRNTGDRNTGNRNTGYSNTGYSNTGNRNTGYSNTGYSNTGDRNTGDWNTGDRNTGDRNTGNRNTGDWNTGYSNTGYSNTGDRNTGNRNTGYSNTGNRNTGDWNKTNRSSGVFCNKEPEMIMFNKKTNMTFEEWGNTRAHDVLINLQKSIWIYFNDMTNIEKEKNKNNAETCDGYLKEISRKEASKKLWEEIDIKDKYEIMTLPNFDLEIFNDIMELNITKKEYKEVLKSANL